MLMKIGRLLAMIVHYMVQIWTVAKAVGQMLRSGNLVTIIYYEYTLYRIGLYFN